MTMPPPTYRVPVDLAGDAVRDLLQAAGLRSDMAAAVARKLIESELLGHRTHGLQYLPVYLERLGDGRIATRGEIEVVSDRGATFGWRTDRLPGAWVMERLVAEALRRSDDHPVVTATLANCSHIGALQAYLEDIGRAGRLAQLMVTDPGVASMAPPGGTRPVITSNPIAVCIPTDGDPILIDQSTSLVSNGAVAQYAATGAPLPGEWVVDNQGRPSRDPKVLDSDPPGTLMPLGGETFGYKGFAMALMVDVYALALSGFGRDGERVRGAQGVFLQVLDPSAFGAGQEAFIRSTSALTASCRAAGAVPGGVRLPGERALNGKREQLEHGLWMAADVLDRLDRWAECLPGAAQGWPRAALRAHPAPASR